MAKPVMIQGTCSNAGKSLVTAGLCRVFLEDGFTVAPFKAQNMALNSFVTDESLEMGRAQVTQALACRKTPDVRMNPVLLKPSSDTGSQVIVNGKAIGTMDFTNYMSYKKKLKIIIRQAYRSLASENDIIVIEGAGSPAEINLKKYDIVNMHTAKLAKAPVLIVGDIDRGGVFASFIGTLSLFTDAERDMTKGFIINKFRGEISLLESGIKLLERKTRKKVFGVMPMLTDLDLPEEDSVEFKKNIRKYAYNKSAAINIALIDLPHISNFTDYDALKAEKDVNLYTVREEGRMGDPDIIIIPGSKNVIRDAEHLHANGFYNAVTELAEKGRVVIGICGGFQVLGREIHDPYSIESKRKKINGIGLLDLTTRIEKEKTLTQVEARMNGTGITVRGYEIHHGNTKMNEKAFFTVQRKRILGCISKKGNIWGTYIHGVFDSDEFRAWLLEGVRKKKGLRPVQRHAYDIEPGMQKLAASVREHIDMPALYKIMGIRYKGTGYSSAHGGKNI
ncbi:cobyric acid synthase [Spirochaetota bacterium]